MCCHVASELPYSRIRWGLGLGAHIHAWPITIHHNYFCSLRNPRIVPRQSFPYECDMAAGAFSDEFLLRSTEPTQKEKKKLNNLAVPGPRTNAQGSNRPFGLSPLTLTGTKARQRCASRGPHHPYRPTGRVTKIASLACTESPLPNRQNRVS